MPGERTTDYRWLPWQTRRIIEAVGYGPALALLRARGGTRVRVPRRTQDSAMLETALGSAEAVEQFTAAFAGREYVYLPKHKKLVAHLRDERIRADRLAGDSLNTLALRYDLTVSYVKVILAEAEIAADAPRTADLFDSGGGATL